MQRIDLEEIQERIDQGLLQRSEPPRNVMPSENPDHPIWELWQRMGEMYGHKWHSQQGDEPNDTWSQGLADLNPEQFAHGFRALLDRAEGWPPNLAEFRRLCTGYDPQAWERQAHRHFEAMPRLEDKTAKARKIAHDMAQIKKIREEVGL